MSARRRPRGSMQAAAGRAAPAPPGQETTGAREPRRPVVRIAPVKATFELDPVLLRRVKIWAGRRVLHVAPVVRALLAELVGDERTGARVAELVHAPGRATVPPGAALVKTTYDLAPDLYGELRAWVAEHDTTAAAVVRVLMYELVGRSGGELARRVEARATAETDPGR